METLVFLMLKRENKVDWIRYRGMFASLMKRYPIVVINRKAKGKVSKKIVAFLKRHEDLWIQALSLLGWKPVERHEVPLEKFRELYNSLSKLLETIKDIKEKQSLPKWLSEELNPIIGLGMLTIDKVKNFLDNINRRIIEYSKAPKAIQRPREADTSFLRRLRRSVIVALAIRGTNKDYLRRTLRENLYILLSRGVIPIDYSYNYIIVAKKTYKYRGSEKIWPSYLGYDPLEVLRGLEARPAIIMLRQDSIELAYEKRDIGWGLTVIEKK